MVRRGAGRTGGYAVIVHRPSPAEALRRANERAATEALRRAVAADLAKLIAGLPRKPKE